MDAHTLAQMQQERTWMHAHTRNAQQEYTRMHRNCANTPAHKHMCAVLCAFPLHTLREEMCTPNRTPKHKCITLRTH